MNLREAAQQALDANAKQTHMKLYDVPRNTRIKVDELVLTFHHIDGMYSYCTDDDNNIYHLAAWTEVELT